ncbi:MAG: SDR family oxidoreductase [Phycisphaerales bacterium]|nr:SDR family oxidoreductase [Phycisphaerales bacterium]
MIDLHDKTALVCGSTQGIGRACAEVLAEQGATVVLAARDESALRRVMAELARPRDQRHACVVANFDEPTSVRDRVVAHVAAHGPIEILVNNTGGPPHGPITQAQPQAFLDAFTRHVLCNQLLAQALLPGMKERGYGRIINIISTSVKEPIAGLGVSNTIRNAVANWAKTWAMEVAPLGITVNNVLPGYTETARLGWLIDARARHEGTSTEQIMAGMKARTPMARFGSPREIAAGVAFLASAEASYVTGINLTIDGGRTGSM